MSNLSSSEFTKGYTDFNNKPILPSGEEDLNCSSTNTFKEGFVHYNNKSALSYDSNILADSIHWNGTDIYKLDHADIVSIFYE